MTDHRSSGHAPPDVRLSVLLYHHVGPPRTGAHRALTVSPERFEAQLRALARRGFSGISAAAWLRWLDDDEPLPPRPILLTFDDGYADLAKFAFPALERLGWRATTFVATGTVGSRSEWDQPEAVAHPILAADDVHAWAARGIEFGAHGATHCDLTRLGPERLHEEIVGARDALAELLGTPVTAYAYPYGSYNDEIRKLVGQSFELAFAIDEGLNDRKTDRTRLRRTMVQHGDKTLDLMLRARLGWSPIERVRARARVRDRARRLNDRATGRNGALREP
jgi:peptidoglycan/xylan/chitin deacetylase (PgdA/CDA1 family)